MVHGGWPLSDPLAASALERFSSVYQGDEATVTGSIEALVADPACDAEPISALNQALLFL
ncbi:hypothetical protein [Burkholderia sp. F1]|uniref:hypothetical protein n=1 Tax=Burkholderia sp. F1 TaxID=3366817 RepID=UPI003D734B56